MPLMTASASLGTNQTDEDVRLGDYYLSVPAQKGQENTA